MKTIDPDMKLDGFRLQDALVSIYHTFADTLRGPGATPSPDLYKRAIPEMVFDVAIGAGWVPLSETPFDSKVGTSKGDVVWEADFQITDKMGLPQWILDHVEAAKTKQDWRPPHKSTFTKNQAQRIVQFGEWYVERTYVDSFYDLLRESISFYLAEGTLHEERLKSLPTVTTARQRQDLLDAYVSKRKKEEKAAKMNDIARLAGVDYSVLMKWKKGENAKKDPILDTAPAAQRIALLLRFDQQSSARMYRRDGR